MLKYFTWFFIAATLLGTACKAQPPALANDKESPTATQKALLWEISGNGLTHNSYVYGTIHMIEAADYFLPDGTLAALDASEKVIFEIDMNELSDMSQLMPILEKAFMNDNMTLKDLMSESDYEIVKAHFSKMGLPIFFLEKIKPLFLTAFASGDFSPGDLQSGKIKSYEMEFTEMAQNSNKEIGGLETIDFQLSLFDSIPYEDQATMLIESIKAADTEDDQFKQIVQIYKDQDIGAMYQMMREDEGISEFEDILLIQRNENWIPSMVDEMQQSSCFFAVGAGHLGGPKGVLQLLRNKGYKLTPLSQTAE